MYRIQISDLQNSVYTYSELLEIQKDLLKFYDKYFLDEDPDDLDISGEAKTYYEI